jgi:hypothetical protein
MKNMVCVGDGRGDTKDFATLGLPQVVCWVRTRKDSLWSELPQGAASGRGRRRGYGETRWRPQAVWSSRQGGRVVEVWAQVLVVGAGEGLCGVGGAGLLCDCGAGASEAFQASRAPQAFWVHAVPDGGGGWRLPLALEGLLGLLRQRGEIEVSFGWLKSGFGLGEQQGWGLVSGERSVLWSGWVYGVVLLSGYRAWGWRGGARWEPVGRVHKFSNAPRHLRFVLAPCRRGCP